MSLTSNNTPETETSTSSVGGARADFASSSATTFTASVSSAYSGGNLLTTCSVCKSSVKSKNLPKHMQKVHSTQNAMQKVHSTQNAMQMVHSTQTIWTLCSICNLNIRTDFLSQHIRGSHPEVKDVGFSDTAGNFQRQHIKGIYPGHLTGVRPRHSVEFNSAGGKDADFASPPVPTSPSTLLASMRPISADFDSSVPTFTASVSSSYSGESSLETCSVCKSPVKAKNVPTHMQKVHSLETCSVCKSSVRAKDLPKHMQKVHKGKLRVRHLWPSSTWPSIIKPSRQRITRRSKKEIETPVRRPRHQEPFSGKIIEEPEMVFTTDEEGFVISVKRTIARRIVSKDEFNARSGTLAQGSNTLGLRANHGSKEQQVIHEITGDNDSHDSSRGWGQMRRDHGRFGSFPVHDNHGEDSEP